MRHKTLVLLLGSASLALGAAACRSGTSDNQVEATAASKSGSSRSTDAGTARTPGSRCSRALALA